MLHLPDYKTSKPTLKIRSLDYSKLRLEHSTHIKKTLQIITDMIKFIVVSITVLLIVLGDSQSIVFRIIPNNSLPSQECSNCLTVNELLDNANQFFKTNTMIEFKPGVFTIGKSYGNILIRNVTNITVSGAVHGIKSIIVCSEPFGLTFVNVASLAIQNIHFEDCGSNVSPAIRLAISQYVSLCEFSPYVYPCYSQVIVEVSALAIYYSDNVSLQDIEIERTNGTAMVAIDIFLKLLLNRVILTQNSINCLISSISLAPESYEILNSKFEKGNPTDHRIHLSSGLNVLLRNLDNQRRLIKITMYNITSKNNLGMQGNMLVEIHSCYQAITYFKIYKIKLISYADLTKKYTALGILIKIVFDKCPFQYIQYSEHYLIFQDVLLNNGALVIAVQKKDRGQTYVEAHFKQLEIRSTRGMYAMIMNKANVTITDFRLIHSTNIMAVDSNLRIEGNSLIEHNRKVFRLQNSTIQFHGNTMIRRNTETVMSLIKSSAIFIGNTTLEDNDAVYFNRCFTATPKSCVLAIHKSILKIVGNVTFKRNHGCNGGAIALYSGSHIIIEYLSKDSPTSLTLTGNTAETYGGAVYIEDYYEQVRKQYDYSLEIPCWLRIKHGPDVTDLGIYFKDNKALEAGNGVFGGWLDFCYNSENNQHTRFMNPQHYTNQNEHNFYSSSPVRICLCQNSVPNCNITYVPIVYISPGKTIELEFVAVGQGYGIVPTVVIARALHDMHISKLQQYQTVGKRCTKLLYTLSFNTIDVASQLELRVQAFSVLNTLLKKKQPQALLFSPFSLTVVAAPCSKGYTFNNSIKVCECHHVLQELAIECDIQTGTVKRSREWINTTLFHTIVYNPSEPAVIVHQHCPLNYCKKESMYLNLEQPDDQCHYNRSGTLCGKCKHNTSAVFGSSNCTLCTNNWVFLIVPLVIVTGVILVMFLTILNVTVSSGTINGLIFYANIVRANQSTFFPSNSFLSWFVAWLNLDIGFEVCFYDGLDMYAKTWLQFVFPLYVWLLVILMIISSHYSTRASRVFGNNAVQVLATLFLLSYTKLLRITIVSLSYTELVYPNGYIQKVWLYDGNVDYLQGKHIALFIAALTVLFFLSIPYTFLLVTIQWLQRYTHYSALKWVTRFQPIFDAYTGPYKNKHRYWPGLLLLIRVVLFLTFSLNIIGDPTINLLAIITTILCLLTYSAYLGGVYKSWSLDVLENSFHLNLAILSSATLFISASGGDQSQLVLTSTGIAFSTFILIIAYHIYLRLSKTAHYSKLKKWILFKVKAGREQVDDTDSIEIPTRSISLPTQTVVELHEPLLDSD